MSIIVDRQPEISGLASLGQVIAQAGAQYHEEKRADALRAEARQNQLADRSEARSQQLADYSRSRGDHLADVKDERLHQDAVLARQRQERVQDEAAKILIDKGLLPMDWASKPNAQEMFGGARLEADRRGLAVAELANIRAASAEDFDMPPEERAFINAADPNDQTSMDRAREYGRMSIARTSKRKQAEYNATIAGQDEQAKLLGKLQAERDQLTKVASDTELNASDMARIERQVEQQIGSKDYLKLKAKGDPEGVLAAARNGFAKEQMGLKYAAAQTAAQRLRSIDEQFTAISRMPARVAAKMHEEAASLGQPTAIDDSDPMKGFKPGTQAPKPAPAAAAPASLDGSGYGGIRGALENIPVAMNNVADLASLGYDFSGVPHALDYIAGGAKQAAEGDASRLGDVMAAAQRFNARNPGAGKNPRSPVEALIARYSLGLTP